MSNCNRRGKYSWTAVGLFFLVLGTGCEARIDDATYIGSLTGVYDIMGPAGPVARGTVRNLQMGSSAVGLGQRKDDRGEPIWILALGKCTFTAQVSNPGKFATFVAKPQANASGCWLSFDGITPADRLVNVTLLTLAVEEGQLTMMGGGTTQTAEGRGSFGINFIGTRKK